MRTTYVSHFEGVPDAKMSDTLLLHLENCITSMGVFIYECETNKGLRRMPRHQMPMKDVEGCDKPGGAA